jgi:hypothetical protein
MPCILMVRGGEIELHPSENFNKIRHRANKAKKMLIDYQNGNIDGETKGQKFELAHVLSFRTAAMEDDEDDAGGRISIDIESYIGIMSTEPKDVGGGGGNHEDYDDDDEEEQGEEEDEEGEDDE